MFNWALEGYKRRWERKFRRIESQSSVIRVDPTPESFSISQFFKSDLIGPLCFWRDAGMLRGPTRLHDAIYGRTCRQLGHAEIVCGEGRFDG
jgi:hypothetical protein